MSLKVCPQCSNEYELDVRFCPLDGSTLRAKSAGNDLVGTVVAERYEVLKKLGEGGMGQVYLAQHIRIKRKSALKIMHPSMVHDPDAISRFYREAENASKISHQNVAAIYDFGETSDGLIYLAMEFVEGQALTNLIEKKGALPARRAAEITRQAAEALGVAHEMGIVHRDLKPDNIMIAPGREGADLVKVVDFGIAKVADNEGQKVTKTGLVVGTPEYMSPEQLAGDKLDGRSDIYSLALVAFNMFTGRLPFPSETVQESMIMRLTDRPRTLAEMKPDTQWPPDLEQVMRRALERDSKERYQRATDFGRAISAAVAHMPDEVTAAEAGTMVLGAVSAPSAPAVPATMISGSAPPGGATAVLGGPTPSGAMSATGVHTTGYAPGPAAPPGTPARKRSVAPLVGGAAVAIALIAGAAMMLRPKSNVVTADTANGVTARDSAPVVAVTDTSRSMSGPVVDTPRVTSTTVPPSNGTRPPRTTRIDARADLQAISALVDPARLADEADEIHRRVDRVLSRPISGADSALALYYKATAFLGQGKETEGCALLRQLRVDDRNDGAARGADELFRQACQ